ncbi:MAG: hypothetical protein NVS2B12_05590 [Ktedonobacteraceae bacterium]
MFAAKDSAEYNSYQASLFMRMNTIITSYTKSPERQAKNKDVERNFCQRWPDLNLLNEWQRWYTQDVQAGQIDWFANMVGHKIYGVTHAQERLTMMIDREWRTSLFKKRLRRNHKDSHGVPFPAYSTLICIIVLAYSEL